MDGIEFKELFKVAVETLREKTITPLLEADATYQEDSDNEGIAEMHYLQLDLTEEQRKVCNRLLECRDKQDIEYATHAYIAGLYDAFQIMAVLFPDKWDTDADCHPKRPPVPYYPASVSHIIRPAINHYSTVLLT